MNDHLEVLKTVARRLRSTGIQYMLSGSVAMNYYAEPRMTRDVDVVVALEAADADRIVELFESDFYIDVDTVREAVSRRGMFNAIDNRSVVKVDFIVRKEAPYRLEEFSRRRTVDVDGEPIVIVSPEDLILSKLAWAKDSRSEVQLRDVRSVIDTVPDLDWPYIERWALVLSIEELLREVRT